jgi:selenocysteine lyase
MYQFYGPRGGCLYARNPKKDTPVFPTLFGGGQEQGMRPGTENTVVVAGLGCAAQLVTEKLDKFSLHFQHIRKYLEVKLKVNQI